MNRKGRVARNFDCLFETEELLNVTGSQRTLYTWQYLGKGTVRDVITTDQ